MESHELRKKRVCGCIVKRQATLNAPKLKKNTTLPGATVTASKLVSMLIKDWSQFVFGLWRNKLKNVVHTV